MVLSLGFQETQASCQNWINSHGLTYEVLSDMSGQTSQLFIPVVGGYLYFPHNCVVDQTQIMRYTTTSWYQSAVVSMVQSLMRPEARVSPSELNYGTVNFGEIVTRDLVIDNTGTGILQITNITASNPRFLANPTSGQVYSVRDSLAVTVTFLAAQSGSFDEDLTVVTNGGTIIVNLLAQVTGSGAFLWTEPTSINFGEVEVGSSSDETFWAYNYGELPVNIASISNSNPVFSVSPQSGTIQGGDSLEVTVTATPTEMGEVTDVVSLESNGGDRDIGVSVLGIQALIGSSTSTVNFGTVNVGSFQTKWFRVRNDGTGVLNITNIALEINIESMTHNMQNTTINPGDSSVCILIWTPHSEGDLEGTITFQSNGGELVINLTGVAQAQGVNDAEYAIPTKFSLEQNFPNPFNSSTMIPYALPHAAPVQITIYNTYGRLVRSIEMGEQPAGWHRAYWSGDDNHGKPVSSGIYFYRLLVDGRSLDLRKMVYMK